VWEHFDHGSDIGVRGIGATKAEAFEQAALALIAVITDPSSVHPTTPISVDCEAPSDDLLFVDWLNALVYEMATRRMLFGRFEVRTDDGHLHGTIWGEPVDRDRHTPAVEVKGATQTELHVARQPDGQWRAECVVDV
jgi:tRNA nucleotidyltransferase (CCA-adding enzyme)